MYAAFIRSLAFALALFPALASAQMSGGMMFPGPGTPASSGASYSGPGDIVSSATVFYSCARVYNLADASTSTNLCDLVDSGSPTVVICTLRGTTAGTVDLAGTYCTGSVTPATKCAAATGAVCQISKAYNQVNPGTLDALQSNALIQPRLKFSALNSLPSMNFFDGNRFLETSGTVASMSEPITWSYVAKRVSNTGNFTAVLDIGVAGAGNEAEAGFNNTVNTWYLYDGNSIPTASATDSAFHSNQGVFNNAGGTSSFYIDGSATTASLGGAVTITSGHIWVGANVASAAIITGEVMEAGLWNLDFTVSSRRNNMDTNQHGANGYNF